MAFNSERSSVSRIDEFGKRLLFMTLAALTAFNTARIIVVIHADIFKPACSCFVRKRLFVLLTNTLTRITEFRNLRRTDGNVDRDPFLHRL